jgi:hypothetical protein
LVNKIQKLFVRKKQHILAGNIFDRIFEKRIGECQLFISDGSGIKDKRMVAPFTAT